MADSESAAERQIRKAMERGEFDDLPGAGKPFEDAGSAYDPAWWVKRWIARNRDDAEMSERTQHGPDDAADPGPGTPERA